MSGIKSVAVTRPLQDAQKLALELQAKGYATYLVPMLDIRPIMQCVPQLEAAIVRQSPQAICVTSRHAVRMLARQHAGRAIPLCAVGAATAGEAKAAGFSAVADAGGNARALTEYILKQYDPKQGPLLYARGADVATDIAADLRGKGVAVTEIIAYEAGLAQSLPPDYVDALKTGKVDAVMFFSRRSAENYVRLARDAALQPFHSRCVGIGDIDLSQIAAALRFQKIQQSI